MSRLIICRKSDQTQVLEILKKNDDLQLIGDFLGFELTSKKSLPEMAAQINALSKNFQCILKKDEEEAPPQMEQGEPVNPPNQDMPQSAIPMIAVEAVSDRVAPALAILKDLLKAAEDKRKIKAEAESIVEEAALASQSAQVVMEQPEQVYVSVDGDNIGNAVARAEANDNEQEIKEMSDKINQGQNILQQWAVVHSGIVIQQGGDEGLVKVPSAALEQIEELRKEYEAVVGATLTVGIGKTISQSTKARMLGKLRGKDQVCYYEEDATEKELQVRLKEKDQTEASKIEDSGVLNDNA